MVVPLVHPAARDCTWIGTAQQFAGINKGLIVQGPEVYSVENNEEARQGVRKHFNSRLENESLEARPNFLWLVLLLVAAGILSSKACDMKGS